MKTCFMLLIANRYREIRSLIKIKKKVVAN